jgi:hypothetical protein
VTGNEDIIRPRAERVSGDILCVLHSHVGSELDSTGEEGGTNVAGQADVQVATFNMLENIFAQLLFVAAVCTVPNFGSSLIGRRGTMRTLSISVKREQCTETMYR